MTKWKSIWKGYTLRDSNSLTSERGQTMEAVKKSVVGQGVGGRKRHGQSTEDSRAVKMLVMIG